MSRFAFPITVILLGVGWLLDSLALIPDVSLLWVFGLGATGFLILAVQGLTKESVVFGPFLMAAAVSSALRQSGFISFDLELPLLVIVFGILLAVSSAAFSGQAKEQSRVKPLN